MTNIDGWMADATIPTDTNPFEPPTPTVEWPPTDGMSATDASAVEVTAVSDFISRRKREDARYADATNPNHYLVVTFDTARHCQAFCRAAGLDHAVWQDGPDVAKHLGIDVEWPT